MSARPDADLRFGRTTGLVFGGLLALALAATLFPWFPGRQQLEVGATAPDSLVAPRDAEYDSEVLTEQRRDEAAAAVADVLVLDPSVRDQQLAELDRQLASIDAARRDGGLSASARESAMRAASASLSERGAAALAESSNAEWGALEREARQALGETLERALVADDLQSARLRAAALLSPLLSADQALALSELLDPLVLPTLTVDAAQTERLREQARAAQPSVPVTVARGEVVVAAGDILTAADIERLEQAGLRRSGVAAGEVIASTLMAALLGAAAGGYLVVMQPASLATRRRLALFALLLIVPSLAVKLSFPLLLPDEARHFLAYGIPVAASPIAAAVLFDVTGALVLTLLIAAVAAFVTVMLPADLGAVTALETARAALVIVAASLAGSYAAAQADRLQRYLMAGVAAGGAAGLALLALWLVDVDRGALDLLWIVVVAAGSGLLSATIAVGAFVLLSRPFGIITRVELMELAQLTHPLLRRLQDEAAGTFQHSILVGNMAERAADRIGADPLLVRVGAYYHDIGKLVAPGFFVENAPPGENPHDGLDPLQSTRVIHQHVTGGIDLARREGLPAAVAQFIPQHHGTRLMTFFYRRAAETDPDIDLELFRYPGPKPQSRETALVMLADACEAAVRAGTDHSPERIHDIVGGLIRERIDEGQLNECDISLRDLTTVAGSFEASLGAAIHARVEYPEPTERELAERAETSVGDPSRASVEACNGDRSNGAARDGSPPQPESETPEPAEPVARGDARLTEPVEPPPVAERPAPAEDAAGPPRVRERAEDDP